MAVTTFGWSLLAQRRACVSYCAPDPEKPWTTTIGNVGSSSACAGVDPPSAATPTLAHTLTTNNPKRTSARRLLATSDA